MLLSPLTLLRSFLRRFGAGLIAGLWLAVAWAAPFRIWGYWHPERALLAAIALSLPALWLAWRSRSGTVWGTLLMAFLAGLLEWGIFYFFNRVFRNFMTLEELGAKDLGDLRFTLIEQLLRLIFSLGLSLLFLSMTSASLSAIFLSDQAPPLLLAPRHWLRAFLARFATAALSVSYMVFAMLIPCLLALGKQLHAPPAYYGWVLLALALLALPPLVGGVAITALLIRLFPVNRLQQVLLVVTVVTVAALVIVVRASSPEALFNPASSADLRAIAESMNIGGLDKLPGAWVARLLVHAVRGEAAPEALPPLLWLNGAALAVLALLARGYARTFARAQERTGVANAKPGRWPRGGVALLWVKDLRLFSRDAKEWSQVLMLGALLIIYLYNIKKMPADLQVYRSAIVFINLAILGFILSALNLRFTFSAMALEGPGVWCLLKAPFPRAWILWEKTLFSFLPISGFALLLTALAGRMMHLDAGLQWLSLGLSALFAVVLHLLALAFGLAQYRPPESDPVKMALSPGGVGFMATSLGFVIGALILAARVILTRMYGRPSAGWGPMIILLTLSVMISILCLAYSQRRIMTLEW